MGTFANSEDPDEMQHNTAIHPSLRCEGKKDPQIKEYNIFLKL